MCCGEESELPEKYREDRKCTDIIFLLLFIVFWIAFIVIAGIAFANGDPDRLLYGTDYLGYVCGRDNGPPSFGNYIQENSSWQSPDWNENKFLWYPVSPNSTFFSSGNGSALDIFNYGVCVKVCPYINQTTIDAIKNKSYNFFALENDLLADLKIKTYGYDSRVNQTIFVPLFYWIIYSSNDFYRRCIPQGLSSAEGFNATISGIPGGAKTTKFFFRGVMEIANSWRVFIIITVVAIVLCFLYVYLMRFFIKPLTYLVIILLFCVLCVCGYLCLKQAENLEFENENRNPKDSDYDRYVKAWRISGYIIFGLAALYVLLVFWFKKRIDEACGMIKMSGRVIASSPTMLAIPPIVAFAVICIALWCIFVAIYLYTSDSYEKGRPTELKIPYSDYWGEYVDNSTWFNSTFKKGNDTFINATSGFLDADTAKRNLLLYDLFAFLWTMGFINAFGFTIIAFCTIFWYYSDVDSDKKAVPTGGVCKATCWIFFYHMGTIAFGSFLIALVQFLRIIMRYIAEKCEAAKQNDLIKCVLCVVECCLACWERIIRIISKNAYIMMCITSDSFCFAARDAFNIILDNLATWAILNFITEVVVLLGKLLVLIGCLALSWWMMDNEDLAPEVETKIMPLIVVALIVYFLCCIFFDVYTTCIDASFICYHHDLKVNAGKGIYYYPEELDGQIKGHSAAKNKEKFDAVQQKEAGGEPFPKQQ